MYFLWWSIANYFSRKINTFFKGLKLQCLHNCIFVLSLKLTQDTLHSSLSLSRCSLPPFSSFSEGRNTFFLWPHPHTEPIRRTDAAFQKCSLVLIAQWKNNAASSLRNCFQRTFTPTCEPTHPFSVGVVPFHNLIQLVCLPPAGAYLSTLQLE